MSGANLTPLGNGPGRGMAPRLSSSSSHSEQGEAEPTVFKVYRGTVKSVTAFGAFVELPGFRKQGLIHISHISNFRVEKVEDVLTVGDPVFVKVISLTDGKIALTMRHVHQTTGEDSDANNVLLMQDPRKRGTDLQSSRFELGAVYNVTCSRCGAAGHLAQSCHSGGKQYALLSLDDLPAPSAAAAADAADSHDRKKKKRKHENKDASSDSESDGRHHHPDKKKKKRSSHHDADDRHRHRSHHHVDHSRGDGRDRPASSSHHRR